MDIEEIVNAEEDLAQESYSPTNKKSKYVSQTIIALAAISGATYLGSKALDSNKIITGRGSYSKNGIDLELEIKDSE